MSILSSILRPILRPVVSGVLVAGRIRPPAPGGSFTYRRSDGTSSIFRPDATSIYTRP